MKMEHCLMISAWRTLGKFAGKFSLSTKHSKANKIVQIVKNKVQSKPLWKIRWPSLYEDCQGSSISPYLLMISGCTHLTKETTLAPWNKSSKQDQIYKILSGHFWTTVGISVLGLGNYLYQTSELTPTLSIKKLTMLMTALWGALSISFFVRSHNGL